MYLDGPRRGLSGTWKGPESPDTVLKVEGRGLKGQERGLEGLRRGLEYPERGVEGYGTRLDYLRIPGEIWRDSEGAG